MGMGLVMEGLVSNSRGHCLDGDKAYSGAVVGCWRDVWRTARRIYGQLDIRYPVEPFVAGLIGASVEKLGFFKGKTRSIELMKVDQSNSMLWK